MGHPNGSPVDGQGLDYMHPRMSTALWARCLPAPDHSLGEWAILAVGLTNELQASTATTIAIPP